MWLIGGALRLTHQAHKYSCDVSLAWVYKDLFRFAELRAHIPLWDDLNREDESNAGFWLPDAVPWKIGIILTGVAMASLCHPHEDEADGHRQA